MYDAVFTTDFGHLQKGSPEISIIYYSIFTVYFILILVSLAILLAVISLAISFLKNFKIGFWTILIAGAMIGMGGIVLYS